MTANLIASLIFGTIGFSAFIYGKKNARYKAMVIGLLLMGYTWVVPDNNTVLYLVGIGLTLALYFFRD
jgi:hypothetical protein